MKIAITCGGTGGHMLPGIAVADELLNRGHDVKLILSGRNVESEVPQKWLDKIIHVRVSPISIKKPLSFIKAFYAFLNARKKIKSFNPDVVLAMGSYTSIPSCLAARTLRTPIVLHEANVIPGKANKFLHRFASKVFVSFDETKKYLTKNKNIVLTGLPIRLDILNTKKTERDNTTINITIMGGSQGATAINNVACEVVKKLTSLNDLNISVTHIAGKNNYEEVCNAYSGCNKVKVYGYTKNMPEIYSSTDIAISRAGANSCYELCYFGIPSILIPLPNLANDHQLFNAQAMENIGISKIILQKDLSEESLLKELKNLIDNQSLRMEMSSSAKEKIPLDAVTKISDEIASFSK